jgi:hypothetical protein
MMRNTTRSAAPLRALRSSRRSFNVRRHPAAQLQLVRSASSFGGLGNFPGQEEDEDDAPRSKAKSSGSFRIHPTLFKMFESAATTFASLAVLGLAGYGYHKYYKHLVLKKIHKAFAPGDPVLDLAASSSSMGLGKSRRSKDEDAENWIVRPEQEKIDKILDGTSVGHYHLLIGEKGTGKSSMLIEAMRKVDGEGISMFDAHADLEIFRIRLGKSLDYEYHEDYIGSLFSIRGPRDTTALLDIERAFNKLEKIALQRRKEEKKGPLILIINCAHLIRDDEDGHDLLELMQQRAEQWAAANLLTMVLNSDDYWIYERMKRYATRMEVTAVLDLPKDRALTALSSYRKKYFPEQACSSQILEQVYDQVGGRLTYLNRVVRSEDMLKTCRHICSDEKTWFLNKCGILGESMDDDVMDQQKYASAAMVLAKELVDMEKEMASTFHSEKGHILPQLPLYKARQVMTRADFIQLYDHDNIFTIDSRAMVRADSVPMMNAFREICAEPGFAEYLQDTLDRISAIESLQRTKELTMKDLWIEQQGEQRGKYSFVTKDTKGRETGLIEMRVTPDETADEEDD